jgi:hypothetical protein
MWKTELKGWKNTHEFVIEMEIKVTAQKIQLCNFSITSSPFPYVQNREKYEKNN